MGTLFDRLKSWLYKGNKLRLTLFVVLFVSGSLAHAAVPLTEVYIADVTPKSFSVFWRAEEAATGTIEIYQDPLGTVPFAQFEADQSFINTSLELKALLEANGLLRVRVSGLEPNTPYFFRLVTTSSSTGIPDSTPAAGALLSVVTEGSNFVVSNDTLGIDVKESDGITPVNVGMALVYADGSGYPLSYVISDGYQAGHAGVSLSNFYDGTDSNRELVGNESIKVLLKGPLQKTAATQFLLPASNQLAEYQPVPGGSLIFSSQAADSDNDFMPDAWEMEYGLEVGVNDAGLDKDNDGVTNYQEYMNGSNPLLKDSDGDGMEDGEEINVRGTLAFEKDTDQDGVEDNDELALGIDPLNRDFDGDDIIDGVEISFGTDPKNNLDFPVIDKDGDGVSDLVDNCVSIPNANQLDTDLDQMGDACDSDDDNDGIADSIDNSPLIANPGQEDDDNDGAGNVSDNCNGLFNSDQADNDVDGYGDLCDDDDDNDGVNDFAPLGVPSDEGFLVKSISDLVGTTLPVNNSTNAYVTMSKIDTANGGSAIRLAKFNLRTREFVLETLSEEDAAVEGVLILYVDNNMCGCVSFPERTSITLQTNNGIITAYFPEKQVDENWTAYFVSTDGSTYSQYYQTTTRLATLEQTALVRARLDNCQFVYNPAQSDVDSDGIGDFCDASPVDLDGDGVLNENDNCPEDHNPDQADFDSDLIGNVCDPDNDNDGLDDSIEVGSLGTNHLLADTDGDGIADPDEDFDRDGYSNIYEILNGTDPNVPDIRLQVGLNYFSFPGDVDLMASDVLTNLGGAIAVSKIQNYKPDTKTVESLYYNQTVLNGDDFPVQSGHGYFVDMLLPVVAPFAGAKSCLNYDLDVGPNVIGFACAPSDLDAFTLLDLLGGENYVTTIQRYNAVTGVFESTGFSGSRKVGVNFPINNQEAYVVNLIQQFNGFSLNVTPPPIDASSLSSAGVLYVSEYEVVGYVDDVHATVLVNGEIASITQSGSKYRFSKTVTLQPGTNAVEISIRTGNNITNTETFSLNYVEPPSVVIDTWENGAQVQGELVSIGGTISDSAATLSVGGISAVVANGRFVVEDIPLQVGENTLQLVGTASNGAPISKTLMLSYQPLDMVAIKGRGTSSVFNALIDDAFASQVQKYTATLMSPPSGFTYKSDSFTKPGLGRLALAYTLSVDASVPDDVYKLTYKVRYLSDASELLFVRYFTVNVSVIENTDPPLVTISDPLDGSTVNIDTVTVTGSVDDSGATVEVNGVQAVINGNVYTATVTLSEGANVITVTATNAYGSDSESIQIEYVISNAPTISIDSPLDGVVVSVDTIQVSGTISDSSATVEVNGVAAVVTGTSYEAEIVLTEGVNQISATVTSVNGSRTVTIEVIYSNQTESVAVDPGLTVTGSREIFTSTANFSALSTYTHSISGTPSFLTVSLTGASTTPPDKITLNYQVVASSQAIPGTYPVTITANFKNSSGDPLFTEVFIVEVTVNDLGLTTPNIQLISPTDGATVTSDTIVVSGTASNDPIEVTVNGVVANLTSGTFDATVSLNPGTNQIEIIATNANGSSSVVINVNYVSNTTSLVASVGGQVAAQRQVVSTPSNISSIALYSYSTVGMPAFVSFAPTGASFQSSTQIGVDYQLDISNGAAPGNYSFTVNLNFLDSNSAPLFVDTFVIDLEITP